MKAMKYVGGLILAGLVLTLASCDKIKDGDRLIDQGVVEIKSERCVLLEDYTGVYCVNCPTAAAEIVKLQAAYGKNLVVVGMYPLEPSSLTCFPGGMRDDPDLRTDAAQTYATHYRIEEFPKGLVNRKGGPLNWQSWGGTIQEVFDDTTTDYVNLAVSAQLQGAGIQVNINGNFKQDYSENGDINVIAMILEDNLVTRQNSQEGVVREYVHNHVMRAVISDDVWGDKVLDARPSQGESFTKQYTVELKTDWKRDDIALVVAVVNADTHEVLQAAYAHVR